MTQDGLRLPEQGWATERVLSDPRCRQNAGRIRDELEKFDPNQIIGDQLASLGV